MTKKQCELVKGLLAQTQFNTSDGDFYQSIYESKWDDLEYCTITLFPQEWLGKFHSFELECIMNVCSVVGVYFSIKVEQNLPVIRIS